MKLTRKPGGISALPSWEAWPGESAESDLRRASLNRKSVQGRPFPLVSRMTLRRGSCVTGSQQFHECALLGPCCVRTVLGNKAILIHHRAVLLHHYHVDTVFVAAEIQIFLSIGG